MKFSLLRAERRRRGWSQATVAQALGVTTRTVMRWEQGQVAPHPYYREPLCNLFDKTAEELGFLSNANENEFGISVFRSYSSLLSEYTLVI